MMATVLEKRAAWFVAEKWAGDPAVWQRWVVDSLLLAIAAANDRQGKPDGRITQTLVVAYGRVVLNRESTGSPEVLTEDGAVARVEAVTRVLSQLMAVTDLYGHMKGVVDAAAGQPAVGG